MTQFIINNPCVNQQNIRRSVQTGPAIEYILACSHPSQQHGALVSWSYLWTASSSCNFTLGCYFGRTVLAVPPFYYYFFQSISFRVCCFFSDSFTLSINFWNISIMPSPCLAEILNEGIFSFLACSSICFSVQAFCLLCKSLLLPTRAATECGSLWSLQNSSHLAAFYRVFGQDMSQMMSAQCESFKQLGMSALKRSCPAVSQSCNRQVLLSCTIFLTRKSMPMVA